MISRPVSDDMKARVRQIIELTLQGESTGDIAKKLGLKTVTVRNIKQRYDFKNGFERAMEERKERFMQRLMSSADAALATQLRCLAAADRWKDKNDAANSILDRAGVPRETRVEERKVDEQPKLDLTKLDDKEFETFSELLEKAKKQ